MSSQKKVLRIEDEEAMCLEERLENGERTVPVQVNIRFKDQYGNTYSASREIKVRLRKEQ